MMQHPDRSSRVAAICTLVAMAVLAACPDRTPAPARDTTAESAIDGAQSHMEVAAGDDELMAEARRYRLTMPKVEQYLQAIRNLHALERDDPALRRRMEAMAEHEDRSLREMVTMIEQEPQLRRAIEGAGISVHDYMMISLTLMQAMMAHAFQKEGYIREIPPEVSAENVAFIRANEARLEEIGAELNRLGAEAAARAEREP